MVGALKALGIKLEERWEAGEMVVHGCGGRFPSQVRAGGGRGRAWGARWQRRDGSCLARASGPPDSQGRPLTPTLPPPPTSTPQQGAELFLGNAGTAMRPLTAAVAAAGRGTFVLDGVARMRERPIEDLVDGLVQLGVKAKCTMGTGCPPVEVIAEGLPPGKVRRRGAGWPAWAPPWVAGGGGRRARLRGRA
jgi:3-phosphoshikimate 1-carboxyvinyltransferase